MSKTTPERFVSGTLSLSLFIVGAVIAIPGIAIITLAMKLAERADLTFQVKS
jgi:hypothetical protein